MNKVLVIAVHPCDETPGYGGTLLKNNIEGGEIHWLIATEMKKSDSFDETSINKRNNEIDKINKLYNFSSLNQLNISTTKVSEESEKNIEAIATYDVFTLTAIMQKVLCY